MDEYKNIKILQLYPIDRDDKKSSLPEKWDPPRYKRWPKSPSKNRVNIVEENSFWTRFTF